MLQQERSQIRLAHSAVALQVCSDNKTGFEPVHTKQHLSPEKYLLS